MQFEDHHSNSNDIKVLLSECSFNNNSHIDSGGSVYFRHMGSIVQHKICSLSSQIIKYGNEDDMGHHSYSDLDDSDPNKLNYIHDSSIYLCGNSESAKTILVGGGKISIQSTNISKCTASKSSGFGITGNGQVSQCTIDNTTCDSEVLIHYDSGTTTVSFCNILNNQGSPLVMFSADELTLDNCYIFKNKGSDNFILFISQNPISINLQNSYVQSDGYDGSHINPNNVDTSNEETSLSLSHFSNSDCEKRIYLDKIVKYDTYYNDCINLFIIMGHSFIV